MLNRLPVLKFLKLFTLRSAIHIKYIMKYSLDIFKLNVTTIQTLCSDYQLWESDMKEIAKDFKSRRNISHSERKIYEERFTKTQALLTSIQKRLTLARGAMVESFFSVFPRAFADRENGWYLTKEEFYNTGTNELYYLRCLDMDKYMKYESNESNAYLCMTTHMECYPQPESMNAFRLSLEQATKDISPQIEEVQEIEEEVEEIEVCLETIQEEEEETEEEQEKDTETSLFSGEWTVEPEEVSQHTEEEKEKTVEGEQVTG